MVSKSALQASQASVEEAAATASSPGDQRDVRSGTERLCGGRASAICRSPSRRNRWRRYSSRPRTALHNIRFHVCICRNHVLLSVNFLGATYLKLRNWTTVFNVPFITKWIISCLLYTMGFDYLILSFFYHDNMSATYMHAVCISLRMYVWMWKLIDLYSTIFVIYIDLYST